MLVLIALVSLLIGFMTGSLYLLSLALAAIMAQLYPRFRQVNF